MQPEMERRRRATEATRDRFRGKPFKFGRFDCGQMTAFHLRAMKKPVRAAKAGRYHSLLGATKALNRLGFRNLSGLMDAHFERIPPAAAALGDVVSIASEEGPGGLFVVIGNGRVFGYHQDALGAEVLQPLEPLLAAWRVA
jgi:hypothetical protein